MILLVSPTATPRCRFGNSMVFETAVMSDFSHFGIPESNLRAAEQSGERQRRHKFHTYVPTRKEVATLKPGKLKTILTGWMCNAAIEIIPSRTQIAEVKSVLMLRPDADELRDIISMCDCYISGE